MQGRHPKNDASRDGRRQNGAASQYEQNGKDQQPQSECQQDWQTGDRILDFGFSIFDWRGLRLHLMP